MSAARQERILVAGIGNIFLGDDGFGCEVARALATMDVSREAKVIDYGIRGIDLAYALIEPYDVVIFVDAIARGGRPGSVYLLQPVNSEKDLDGGTALDPHAMDPMHLMAMARSLGEIGAEIYIVGCEPHDFGDELEGRMELSTVVRAAVPEAAQMVVELIDGIHAQKMQAAESLVAVQ
jgi:hydrogenase maturation protease